MAVESRALLHLRSNEERQRQVNFPLQYHYNSYSILHSKTLMQAQVMCRAFSSRKWSGYETFVFMFVLNLYIPQLAHNNNHTHMHTSG